MMGEHVLSIVASDVMGMSGMAADIRTIAAMGARSATVVPAFIRGDEQPQVLPSDLVMWQVRQVLESFKPSVIKLGRLYSAETVDDLTALLAEVPDEKRKLVIGLNCGGRHVNADEMASMKRTLLLQADLVVLGVPEMEMLTGYAVHDIVGVQHAAALMRKIGVRAVLVRGSEAVGQDVFMDDVRNIMYPLVRSQDARCFDASAAVACMMARGLKTSEAIHQLCAG